MARAVTALVGSASSAHGGRVVCGCTVADRTCPVARQWFGTKMGVLGLERRREASRTMQQLLGHAGTSVQGVLMVRSPSVDGVRNIMPEECYKNECDE
ncbi:hypothetical protein RIF29_41863 [Crotalaria pallida]|uniref:Uncharacterized protein n=1 Tax=Crotalaria pallida TaxID=3830 RepID=A0AAN9HRX3_CROPI